MPVTQIAIMKALNHKNIVNLREVLSSRTKLYIVMDLVRGGELFEMIENKGELDEVLARKYFQQLIDGIDYCHRRGVCHRDLKVCRACLVWAPAGRCGVWAPSWPVIEPHLALLLAHARGEQPSDSRDCSSYSRLWT